MNSRERFQAVMSFQPFDRLPLVEWAAWWGKTINRWHTEGFPADLNDRYKIYDYLGLEIYWQEVVEHNLPDCPKAPSYGAGIIETERDYESIRKYLYPRPALKTGDHWKRLADRQATGEIVLWFSLEGFFGLARELLGIERHLYAFYDQPKLMHRINSDLSQWILGTIEEISSYCEPDFMTFFEDMSYNHGSMLSEEHFREFLLPYYKIVIPELDRRGIIPIVDSDGDISVPAYWFKEAGLQGILPLERQAGVDLSRLRRDHPRMLFVGHFDKMTMARGEETMRAEFERLLPTAAKGGFIISVDHQTPPGVSLDQYRTYLRLYREYAEKAGAISRS